MTMDKDDRAAAESPIETTFRAAAECHELIVCKIREQHAGDGSILLAVAALIVAAEAAQRNGATTLGDIQPSDADPVIEQVRRVAHVCIRGDLFEQKRVAT